MSVQPSGEHRHNRHEKADADDSATFPERSAPDGPSSADVDELLKEIDDALDGIGIIEHWAEQFMQKGGE
ncbi:ubiquitin-like protein Pup [Streptomyces sp. WAC 01325]|uniref:ubiquitin-like protein Pup n=1 Tax=Streptomyces sp. WAC 01325 TaxID=2203202 RepID=UPI00163BF3CB|nr:ubiquitin-like protein Pup [Streptomyces sp. WAC 01325]